MKLMQRLVFVGFLASCVTSSLHPLKKGSLNAVSCEEAVIFPAADLDNAMVGFSWFKNGFELENERTRCSFESVYPVSGVVNLRGGLLELHQPLILRDATIQSLGTIIGHHHAVYLPTGIIELPHQPCTFQDVNLFLHNDIEINSVVRCKGHCVVHGAGNILKMGAQGKIVVEDASLLEVRNLIFDGVMPDNIVCASDTAKFSFNNVATVQEDELQQELDLMQAAGELITRSRTGEYRGNDGWEEWNSCCGVSKHELLKRIKKLEKFSCCVKTAIDCLDSKIDECCCHDHPSDTSCCDELRSIIEILESQIDECCHKPHPCCDSCCDELRSIIESCCEHPCPPDTSCCDELRSIIESCCEHPSDTSCCDELRSIIEILESIIDQCCPENDCVINVTGQIVFDPVTMTPAEGQAKVFRFDSCAGRCSLDSLPKVTFTKDTLVELPASSRILFTGEGIIEVEDGVRFVFGGSGGFSSSNDWAQIVIEEYATLRPAPGATVVFGGSSDNFFASTACIYVRRNGSIKIEEEFSAGARIIFGDNELDKLDIKFDGVASLLIRDSTGLDENPERASVTFQKAATHLVFDHQSDLSIERGTVEFNVSNGKYNDARDGNPAAGTLEILHFTNGSLLQVLRRGTGPTSEVGLLRLAANVNDTTVEFNGKSGQVINGGHIEYRLFDESGKELFNSFNANPAGEVFESAANPKPSRLEIQNNFFVFKGAEFPMVEVFMRLCFINNSLNADLRSNAISDLAILVKVGSLTPGLDGRLAALRPGTEQGGFVNRDGSIKVLDTGDHDVGYDGTTISGYSSNARGKQRLFRVDVNGVRQA